jgi:hypothetical protein
MTSCTRLLLGIGLAIAACSCRGQPLVEDSADASLDAVAGGDATHADACPLGQPADGEGCDSGNLVGSVCGYASGTCRCERSGQEPPRWSCTGELGTGLTDGGARLRDAEAGTSMCAYNDGGAELDPATRFRGDCSGGCPPGTICAVQIGGVAGGGGAYCAPILDRCLHDLSCACLGSCVCGYGHGQPQVCNTDKTDGGEVILCDDGIR